MSRRRLLAVLGAATVGGIVVATGACATTPTTVRMERIRARRRIRIGIADEAPYGYLGADGRATGAFPEIIRAAMAVADPRIELETITVRFDELIDTLDADRIDVIAAGLTVTAERCRQVQFARPEVVTSQSLGVPPGNPLGLTDLASVAAVAAATPGLRLGVLAGAVEASDAIDAGVHPDQIVELPRTGEMLTALVAGRIDAFALTSRSVERLLTAAAPGAFEATAPSLPVVDGAAARRGSALATAVDDVRFRADLDALLEPLRRDGTIGAILAEFGWTRDEILPAGQPFGCT